MFYGSYMYVHEMLRDRYETEVVPGVPAFAAATAALAEPLVRQTDVLTVLPATLPEPELARRLADTDGAIIMKLGRTFPKVVSALRQAGRLDGAMYVERASMEQQRWMPVAEVDPSSVPYFSLIVVPGSHSSVPDSSTEGSEPLSLGDSESRNALLVVGLGPGPDRWITPEVSAALASVDHVVGYAPYVSRVPQREGLQRHASGNTVEIDRARFALELARKGERVAVVSGGDAGVFGMAAAVFEAADDFPDVDIEVLPGVSAVQAVAAKAGAPIGADFAVISLSDRLKPWSVLERRLHAIGEADLVLAVYNPASRSRVTQVAEMQKLLLEHRSPDTVLIVGRDVGRDEESLTVTTLAELDASTVDMKCLLIVGASSTHVTDTGRVWTPRWVAPAGGSPESSGVDVDR
jgi:precorrin-2 C20-methyltransferase/precorrin-3B C17-methyltransferase